MSLDFRTVLQLAVSLGCQWTHSGSRRKHQGKTAIAVDRQDVGNYPDGSVTQHEGSCQAFITGQPINAVDRVVA